jgi:hypothetical protein
MTSITIRPVNGGWIIEHNGVEHVATDAGGVTEAIRQLSPYVGGGRPTQDDDAVKGEDEAWTTLAVLSGSTGGLRKRFRAALRIAIAANQTQKPMHFTVWDIQNMSLMQGQFIVNFLTQKGATVEWPFGETE